MFSKWQLVHNRTSACRTKSLYFLHVKIHKKNYSKPVKHGCTIYLKENQSSCCEPLHSFPANEGWREFVFPASWVCTTCNAAFDLYSGLIRPLSKRSDIPFYWFNKLKKTFAITEKLQEPYSLLISSTSTLTSSYLVFQILMKHLHIKKTLFRLTLARN